jgi:mRNA-degrading endonuclease YafQ of YafQ-DinJ toxin-antitoxin module
MNYQILKYKYSKQFIKSLKALRPNEINRVKQALKDAHIDTFQPQLRFYRLHPKYRNHFSISAGGDTRIHFEYQNNGIAYLVEVGAHSQLYR